MKTLSEITDYLVLLANDVKTLHWYAIGKDFLENHEELGDFYDELAEDIDNVAEMAISWGEIPNNPSYALCEDYVPLEVRDFDNQNVIDILIDRGNLVLDVIDDVDKEKYRSHVYSELDNVSAKIDKIVNYKFVSKSIEI